jgi:Phytanoyl-CoA dioxygenase (PhyH)
MTETSIAEHGFAVAKVFPPKLARAGQADISDHLDRVARSLHTPFERSRPQLALPDRLDAIATTDRAYANLLRMAVLTDAHLAPALTALAEDPVLKTVAEHHAGRKLGETTVRVRASLSAFPEHRHAWHSDVAIDDGSDCSRVTISAWIPLMDAGPGSGGLEVAVGRQQAPFPHLRGAAFHIDEAALANLPRAEPAVSAGEVLFLDRFTPHRTLPNAGPARFALVVWMKAV